MNLNSDFVSDISIFPNIICFLLCHKLPLRYLLFVVDLRFCLFLDILFSVLCLDT